MDGENRARAPAEDCGLAKFPLGYGLTEAQARAFALPISFARPGTAEPARFSEPGLFVVKGGESFFAQIQCAPFTRPALDRRRGGLKFAIENGYPARGDLGAGA